MSNPTSNFGWQMPTNTDLVSQLPADFEVFGQAVDTSLADLKGGSTGQVLKKNSNTDMDFVWGAVAGDIEGVTAGVGITGGGTSGTVTITNDMATTITTNGDLLYGTGSGTYTRRGIGSTGQVLTVSGGVPTWATPAGGGKILQVVAATDTSSVTNATGTYADTGLSATITPSATTSKIIVICHAGQIYNYPHANTFYSNFRIIRGATELQQTGSQIGYLSGVSGGAYNPVVNGAALLDTPATTSATTYKLQFNNGGGGYTSNSYSLKSFVLMEVGA